MHVKVWMDPATNPVVELLVLLCFDTVQFNTASKSPKNVCYLSSYVVKSYVLLHAHVVKCMKVIVT
jgi:hypothetical protein